MNNTQLELTKLLGKKEVGWITFHSWDSIALTKDITLTDFHRWLNENNLSWGMSDEFWISTADDYIILSYDSSKELLEQSEECMKKIIELITNNQ